MYSHWCFDVLTFYVGPLTQAREIYLVHQFLSITPAQTNQVFPGPDAALSARWPGHELKPLLIQQKLRKNRENVRLETGGTI